MLRIIIVVLVKEIKEIYRERIFLFFLLLPVMFFPVYNIGLSYMSQNINDSEMKTEICNVGDISILNDFYIKNENIELIECDNPIEALKNRKIDTIVKYKHDEKSIELIYDSNNVFSLFKATTLGERIQKYIFESINKNTIKCIVVNEKENADSIDKTFSKLIIPFLIIFMNLQDIEKIGNDLMSKEKENKTLEIMISTGINRTIIYIAKVVTLSIVSLMCCGICLFSYYYSAIKCNTEVFDSREIFVLFVASFCMCIVFSVIIVFVSLISKSTKVSQYISSCVTSFVIILSVMVLLIKIKNETIIYLIPIVNLIKIIINLFINSNSINLLTFFIVLLDNFLFSLAIVLLSKRYLYSEKAII